MKVPYLPVLLNWCLALTLPFPALANPDWQSYPLAVVSQFRTPQTFENIAVRSNGQLLLTSTTSSTLFQVSPFFHNQSIAIAQIPQSQGLLGIVELEEDIFYIASSNITTSGSVPGSNNIWRVDLRNTPLQHPPVSLIANIPTAGTLNGMCRLGSSNHTLLVADSIKGQILRVDTTTGSYAVVIDDPILHNTPQGLQVAVDGIHMHGSDLFFTSLNQGIFGKFPLSLANGTAMGPADVIVTNTPGDDFLLSSDGKKAWIAMNGHGTVQEVDIPGRSSRVVVQSTYLSAAAAVTGGRTIFDSNSLYVASGEGSVGNGTGTYSQGIVARIDLPRGLRV